MRHQNIDRVEVCVRGISVSYWGLMAMLRTAEERDQCPLLLMISPDFRLLSLRNLVMMKSASPPFSGYGALAGYILGRPLQDTSLDSVCQAGEVLTSCVTRDVQNAFKKMDVMLHTCLNQIRACKCTPLISALITAL